MWALINLIAALSVVDGALEKCPVMIASFIAFGLIAALQITGFMPTGLASFGVGLFLYALPTAAAISGKFTDRKLIVVVCTGGLMVVEAVMAIAWLFSDEPLYILGYCLAGFLYFMVIFTCTEGGGRGSVADGNNKRASGDTNHNVGSILDRQGSIMGNKGAAKCK